MQGDKYKWIKELSIDWKKSKDDMQWAGIYNRTTEKAVRLTRGLRSGERNTDMSNTLLNRV